MPDRSSQPPPQPTPVADDANATIPQLLDRAAVDYATGWGCPDARATNDGTGSAA